MKKDQIDLKRLVRKYCRELLIKEKKLKSEVRRRRSIENELRKKTRELEVKSHEFEEVNSALRILMRQREHDKREIEEKVIMNVKTLLMPCMEKLKKSVGNDQAKHQLSILESSIKNIASPFARRLSLKYLGMTPKEILVSNFVREGKTTKEIAEFMRVSCCAVDLHRYHIRGKLGLKNKKISLRDYLLSLS